MITDAFDNLTPAKIQVKRNPDAVKVDVLIQTFSHVIAEYVTAHYACEQVGELHAAHGATPVYRFAHNGRNYGFLRTWVGAPACVGTIEEARAVLDFEKVVHFGGAGCLDKEIARGKVMVPTEAYRDEGTSYHYAPAADYIRIPNAAAVAAFMEARRIPFVAGKTWTTDAFYRETCGNFEKRKAEGCISVEMEGAAVQAMCDFRGLDVYMFFTGGDLLDAPEWTNRTVEGQIRHTQHDAVHFEIALALADYAAAL
ncbi:MAG: nucleoside phosphorylase [Clostridia bacterium]|nr:nucleoside phosphorylase [Clostridia bacterium]